MEIQSVQFSVIIPSYNPGDEIVHCLDSLMNQNTKVSYEVIVSDSSSSDIKRKFKSKYPTVLFVQNKQKMLPGIARNFGVKYARGKILAFTDTDCIVDENWLQRINDSFNLGINVLCGAIKNGFPQKSISNASHFMEFGEFLPERKSCYLELAPSCNFSIRKSLYETIGGFQNFIASEDDLFSYQIRQKKEEIYFNNSVLITHLHRTKLSSFLKKQNELGIGFCLTRRVYELRGFRLTKSRIFTLTIIPLRFILIWRKVLRHNLITFFPLLQSSFFITLGLFSYTIGFWQGFKQNPQEPLNTNI